MKTMRLFILAQFAMLAMLATRATLAGSAIAVAGRVLIDLLRNEHIHAAGRAVLRGATRELLRHLATRYKGVFR